jgi:DNA-binding transcriptional MocR family regulator
MMQAILHELLTHPESTTQIDAARDAYAARQLALAAAVRDAGGWLARGDGINAWLRVADERAATVQLAAVGIRVAAGTPFQLGEAQAPYVRVTVGALRDEVAAVGAALAVAQTA